MFNKTVETLVLEIAELKGVVQWQSDLRDTLNPSGLPGAPIALDSASTALLRVSAPRGVVWHLFDHCATVTRIYALFENAVCEIVSEYLDRMAAATPRYDDLDENIRTNHRAGVGQILQKWKPTNSLHSALTEESIAGGLTDGLRGSPYKLLADAFLLDSDNYRTDTVNRVFYRLGFSDVFACVRDCDAVKEFCSTTLSGSETADSFLNEFVRRRNEVAHGEVDSVASTSMMKNYAEFVALVVDALAALLRKRLVSAACQNGGAENIGVVAHTFSNNIVGIEALSDGEVKIGDRFYAAKKDAYEVTVTSLRILTTEHNSITFTKGQLFGMGLNRRIKDKSQLYRLRVKP